MYVLNFLFFFLFWRFVSLTVAVEGVGIVCRRRGQRGCAAAERRSEGAACFQSVADPEPAGVLRIGGERSQAEVAHEGVSTRHS